MGCGHSKEKKAQAVAPEPVVQKQTSTVTTAGIESTPASPLPSVTTNKPSVPAKKPRVPEPGAVSNGKFYNDKRLDREKYQSYLIAAHNKTLDVGDLQLEPVTRVKLFCGDFRVSANIKIPSSIVRLFTSSTFTDTKEERDHMMDDVYPFLRMLCGKLGMTFQVVDMRWGIREQAGADHQTSAICMNQVHLCLDLSAGPAFITMLGNKYGYRPFPATIQTTIFTKLREWIVQQGKYAEELALLDKWFVLEQNAVPQVYKLHTITRLIPDFNHPSDKAKAKAAGNEWWGVFEKMQAVLRHAAVACLDEHEREPFVISVTEEEIYNGILNNPNAAKQCYCFRRDFTGMPETFENTRAAGSFIDMANGKVDKEAVDLLHKLKYEKIPARLPKENIVDFSIPWDDEVPGVRPDYFVSHVEHVKSFVNQFCDIMSQKILDSYCPRMPEDVQDLLEQRDLMKRYLDRFSGRKIVLTKITEYLSVTSPGHPIIIVGPSGSGKSAVLSKTVEMCNEMYPDAVVAVRFCGATTQASDRKNLLKSLCRQIQVAYFEGKDLDANHNLPASEKRLPKVVTDDSDQYVAEDNDNDDEQHENENESDEEDEVMEEDMEYYDDMSIDDEAYYGFDPEGFIPDDDDELMEFFNNLLSTGTQSHPLIVLFDAPNLADSDPLLRWIPTTLPEYCYLFMTFTPCKAYELKKTNVSDDAIVEMPDLVVEAREELAERTMMSMSRSLMDSQREILLNAIAKCPVPLYAKMACERAVKWRSYTKDDDCVLAPDINGLINAIFNDLEEEFGVELTATSLSLIVCSQQGLSDVEMVDLISLDDDVLNDVYQWWVPPVRRLPPLLWSRVQGRLKSYIVQCGTSNMNKFLHNSFDVAIKSRYLSKPQFKDKIYRLLAEYFSGRYGDGRVKPYVGKDGKPASADRELPGFVTCTFMDPYGVLNQRKVDELVPAVLETGDASFLLDCLLNLEYVSNVSALKAIPQLMVQYKKSLGVAWTNWPSGLGVNVLKEVAAFIKAKVNVIKTVPDTLLQMMLETPKNTFLHHAAVRYHAEHREMFLWHDGTSKNDVVVEAEMIISDVSDVTPFCKFSNNGTYLTGANIGVVSVVKSDTGDVVHTLNLGYQEVKDVCYSMDDAHLYMIYGTTIARCTLSDGTCDAYYASVDEPCRCIDCSDRHVAVGAMGARIHVYNRITMEQSFVIKVETLFMYKPVITVKFTKDGRRLMAVCDNTAYIYDISDTEYKLVISIPEVIRAVYNSNYTRIFTVNKTHVSLYDANDVVKESAVNVRKIFSVAKTAIERKTKEEIKAEMKKSTYTLKLLDCTGLPPLLCGTDASCCGDKWVVAAGDHILIYSVNENAQGVFSNKITKNKVTGKLNEQMGMNTPMIRLCEVAKCLAHTDVILALDAHNNSIASAAADASLKMWNVNQLIKASDALKQSIARAPIAATKSMIMLINGSYMTTNTEGSICKWTPDGTYQSMLLDEPGKKARFMAVSSDHRYAMISRKLSVSGNKSKFSALKAMVADDEVLFYDLGRGVVISTVSTQAESINLTWTSGFGCEQSTSGDMTWGDADESRHRERANAVIAFEDGTAGWYDELGKRQTDVKFGNFVKIAVSPDGRLAVVVLGNKKKPDAQRLAVFNIVKTMGKKDKINCSTVEYWNVDDAGREVQSMTWTHDSTRFAVLYETSDVYRAVMMYDVRSKTSTPILSPQIPEKSYLKTKHLAFSSDDSMVTVASREMIWTLNVDSFEVLNTYPTGSVLSFIDYDGEYVYDYDNVVMK